MVGTVWRMLLLAPALLPLPRRLRTLSTPPGLHRDDEMFLFCEQTQMESCFRYSIEVGCITSLEGDENNSSGGRCLTLGRICPRQSTIILLRDGSTNCWLRNQDGGKVG